MSITETPWGKPDTAHDIGAGIMRIDTPSHGGYFVPPALNAIIPAAWRAASFNGQGNAGWYEEDCDWALVALAFPTLFDMAGAQDQARRIFERMIQPKIRARTLSARHER